MWTQRARWRRPHSTSIARWAWSERAKFLEAIAQGILDLGEVLVERVMSESGLPRARVEGERGRTVGQLRLFASLAREGRWLDATLDRAMPERKPLPRADLRAQRIPWGRWRCSARATFRWRFRLREAIRRRRWLRAARWLQSRTRRILGRRSWWGA